MANKILCIKLISGEEVIGFCEEESDTKITLSTVFGAEVIPTEDNDFIVDLYPYAGCNPKVNIQFSRGVFIAEPYTPCAVVEQEYLKLALGVNIALSYGA